MLFNEKLRGIVIKWAVGPMPVFYEDIELGGGSLVVIYQDEVVLLEVSHPRNVLARQVNRSCFVSSPFNFSSRKREGFLFLRT